jgi:hypothetical protein
MNPRRPRTALRSSALPSLAALLASGVVIDGCDASDAAERHERLSTHGENAARAGQGNRFAEALKEIGIGLGLVATSPADIGPAGAVPVVNPQPPFMQPSGAIAPVQPTPPRPEPVLVRSGGLMSIAPVPPPPVETHGHPRGHR